MISAGLVAAVAAAGLVGLMMLCGFAFLRCDTAHDRLSAGLALWLQSILLIAVCGLWAGAGGLALVAAGAVFFAGLAALTAAIKLARHRSLATALARPTAAVGSGRP